MFKEKDLEKIRKLIRRESPLLSEDEIDARARILLGLAHLLVPIWWEEHMQSRRSGRSSGFNEKTGNSPLET